MAPPSRPLPRIYDTAPAEAARAALLARGAPAEPREALRLAVAAAAVGAGGGAGGFRVPAGATAVFVPAEALPGAPAGTPPGDLVAYLLPDAEVRGAAALLGAPGAAVERENDAPRLSQKSARLIGELRALAERRPQ